MRMKHVVCPSEGKLSRVLFRNRYSFGKFGIKFARQSTSPVTAQELTRLTMRYHFWAYVSSNTFFTVIR